MVDINFLDSINFSAIGGNYQLVTNGNVVIIINTNDQTTSGTETDHHDTTSEDSEIVELTVIAIVGIVVGSLIVVGILSLAIYCLIRRPYRKIIDNDENV